MSNHLRKEFKYFLIRQVFPFPIYAFLALFCLTLRFRIEGIEQLIAHYRKGGRIVLASWHQRFFGGFYLPMFLGRKIPIAVMISQSRDGDFIADVVRRIGWAPVRGSSSRRGREALKEIIQAARSSRLVVHIVDGPTGPAGVIKPGLISIANEADARIVPAFVSYDKPIIFNSWDRFMIPRPFSRVYLRFGLLQEVPQAAVDHGTGERYLKEMEEVMYEGYRTADSVWAHNDRLPGFKSLFGVRRELSGRMSSERVSDLGTR